MLTRLFPSLLSRLFGITTVVLLGMIVSLIIRCNRAEAERDVLAHWQSEVTQATRDASSHGQLAPSGVAQQVRFLGQALGEVRLAMVRAQADALAAKQAADAANIQRKKDADDALRSALRSAAAAADTYAHGMRSAAGDPPATDRSGDTRADLSRAAGSAGLADGRGTGPLMVSGGKFVTIPRADFDVCTVIKARLDNAHAWAVGGQR